MSTKVRLSKSKYMAGRQCEKRLWLEIHRPDLIEWDDAQMAWLSQGTAVRRTGARTARTGRPDRLWP